MLGPCYRLVYMDSSSRFWCRHSALTKAPTFRATSFQVLSHLPLLTKLQAWVNVHSQHDVAELVTYLIPRLHLEGFDTSWEARLQVACTTGVSDAGPLSYCTHRIGTRARGTADLAVADRSVAHPGFCIQPCRILQTGAASGRSETTN